MYYDMKIYDRYEGMIQITVSANSDSEAIEEATISAAENGCMEVTDIEIIDCYD
jgi:hypothetical protein